MAFSGLAMFASRTTSKVCLRTTARPAMASIETTWSSNVGSSKYAHAQLSVSSPSHTTVRGMAKQTNKVIKDKRRLRQKSLIAWERRADEKIRYNKYFSPEYIAARPEGQDSNMWYLLIEEDESGTPENSEQTLARLRKKAKKIVSGRNVDETNDQVQDAIVIEHLDKVLESDSDKTETTDTPKGTEAKKEPVKAVRKGADSKKEDLGAKSTESKDKAAAGVSAREKTPETTETEEQRFERYMKKQDEFEDKYEDYDEAMERFENWKKKDLAR
ncbi:hypothetical protein SARC_14649 [Sphaeroforma arctica JP610]|uniref:Uncharacterized protein n=1 Tax=Sphaeroforma arctica JP610 TaxID=667725 RepID=A0A0L0F8B7_9EUKA|nr:hypothetical protein SARC_14649 [Sphaeroforma arctica JP610]KNC72791.1 hypothetical protein SARC_14649 [Sphaeroforma arctica JP610]|eukprot:XP_014146693.1 hypothetical protein SARC_14649 [Sphaeroforma arctica JP610]